MVSSTTTKTQHALYSNPSGPLLRNPVKEPYITGILRRGLHDPAAAVHQTQVRLIPQVKHLRV